MRKSNLIAKTDPVGSSTYYEYDGAGNITAINRGARFSNWMYYELFGGGLMSMYKPSCDPLLDPACAWMRQTGVARNMFQYNTNMETESAAPTSMAL